MLKHCVLNVKTCLLYFKPKLILKTLLVQMSANTAEFFLNLFYNII